MKIKCCKCRNEKDENFFSWRNKSKGTKHTICKECKKNVDNELYQHSKKRKRDIRKRAKNNYIFLKEYVQRLKKFGHCKKCGDDRWYVLEFHHLNNKNDEISNMIKGCSLKNLKNEIRKCELLCANCHKETHYLLRNVGEANLVKALD